MKRIIGLIFGFIGIVAMATSMMFAAYNTDPLAAVAVGGLYLSIIGFIICNLKK